jgi:FRG domain-containing protein
MAILVTTYSISDTTLPRFLEWSQKFPTSEWIFRGQAVGSDPLRPKAGRDDFYRPANDYWKNLGQVTNDLGAFNSWRQRAIAYGPLPDDDFECLALAQHYGLLTRLLDWTANPLVALFFAVERKLEEDGSVFCYLPSDYVDPDEDIMVKRPGTTKRVCSRVLRYMPRPFDRRILAQSGLFTYHPNPREILTPQRVPKDRLELAPEGFDLAEFRVPKDAKDKLQEQLMAVGITRKTLFSDLEGLSNYTNWVVKTKRWRAVRRAL